MAEWRQRSFDGRAGGLWGHRDEALAVGLARGAPTARRRLHRHGDEALAAGLARGAPRRRPPAIGGGSETIVTPDSTRPSPATPGTRRCPGQTPARSSRSGYPVPLRPGVQFGRAAEDQPLPRAGHRDVEQPALLLLLARRALLADRVVVQAGIRAAVPGACEPQPEPRAVARDTDQIVAGSAVRGRGRRRRRRRTPVPWRGGSSSGARRRAPRFRRAPRSRDRAGARRSRRSMTARKPCRSLPALASHSRPSRISLRTLASRRRPPGHAPARPRHRRRARSHGQAAPRRRSARQHDARPRTTRSNALKPAAAVLASSSSRGARGQQHEPVEGDPAQRRAPGRVAAPPRRAGWRAPAGSRRARRPGDATSSRVRRSHRSAPRPPRAPARRRAGRCSPGSARRRRRPAGPPRSARARARASARASRVPPRRREPLGLPVRALVDDQQLNQRLLRRRRSTSGRRAAAGSDHRGPSRNAAFSAARISGRERKLVLSDSREPAARAPPRAPRTARPRHGGSRRSTAARRRP